MPQLSDSEREVLAGFASRVDQNDPGALNNLGVLYYRKGMHREAMEQFKNALKVDSRFNLALENLQYLFSETGIEDPAVKKWREVVESDPDNDEALLRLGVSYKNMGRLDESVRVLKNLVNRNPDHYMARIHLGSALKSLGLNQEALDNYLGAAENVNKSAVFHTELGEIYYNLGRTEEAIGELRSAIKLDPEYWRAHFLLSFANGDVGNFQDALEESRIASKLNPSFQNSEANLALAENRGQPGDSGGGNFKSGMPTHESTSFTLGLAYRERGYYREGLKELEKSLQDMEEKDRVHLEIGKIHMLEGNQREAAKSFLKALQINPESPEPYLLCGVIYHLRGNYRKAAICYLQSFRLSSADADTINNLGVILYQIGLVEDAERMFKKGLNLRLYHRELNFNFLICNLLKEEYMMVENLIQRLEAFVGKSATLYEKRAILHYRMNRLTPALFDIESALSVDQNHSDAIYLKGLIHLREENFKDAIQSILAAAEINREYTGLNFSLSTLDENEQMKVDSNAVQTVDEDLVEILRAGVQRRFDRIREPLVSIVSEGIRELEEAEAPGEGDRKPPEMEKVEVGGKTGKKPVSERQDREKNDYYEAVPGSGNDDNEAETLFEDLDIGD
ncbi:MAG: tetratricopeptide repeat protein [Candidatus Latescibacteria bacterium]|nr:tetratricopeptide repeat protein [bacterium]MBD3423763.1 tetratricopeptide repeat protein [Candidatus Latescibacterota bacterium]